MKINFVPLYRNVRKPEYATDGAAAMDIRAYVDTGKICIYPGDTVVVPTGFALEIPIGWEVQVRPRSGLSLKQLTVANAPGTLDSDYRGEVGVIMHNGTRDPWIINHGDRIAQMIAKPVERMQLVTTDTLTPTGRGAGGFGSTGTD
jgi:dUTP pyrophosphatase